MHRVRGTLALRLKYQYLLSRYLSVGYQYMSLIIPNYSQRNIIKTSNIIEI